MFRTFVHQSRSEPARTILMVVSALTALMEVFALVFSGAFDWLAMPNVAVAVGLSLWGFFAGYRSNVRHMSMSSFWVFMMWLWSGISRMVYSPDRLLFLWAPFIVIAGTMSVVYIYLSHQRRVGIDE